MRRGHSAALAMPSLPKTRLHHADRQRNVHSPFLLAQRRCAAQRDSGAYHVQSSRWPDPGRLATYKTSYRYSRLLKLHARIWSTPELDTCGEALQRADIALLLIKHGATLTNHSG